MLLLLKYCQGRQRGLSSRYPPQRRLRQSQRASVAPALMPYPARRPTTGTDHLVSTTPTATLSARLPGPGPEPSPPRPHHMAAALASSRCCCRRPSPPPLQARARRAVARCALAGGEVRFLGSARVSSCFSSRVSGIGM